MRCPAPGRRASPPRAAPPRSKVGILDWGQTKHLRPEHVEMMCRVTLAMAGERYAEIERLIEDSGEFELEELAGRSAIERRMAWVRARPHESARAHGRHCARGVAWRCARALCGRTSGIAARGTVTRGRPRGREGRRRARRGGGANARGARGRPCRAPAPLRAAAPPTCAHTRPRAPRTAHRAQVLICYTFVDTRWTPLCDINLSEAPSGMLGKNRLSRNSQARAPHRTAAPPACKLSRSALRAGGPARAPAAR